MLALGAVCLLGAPLHDGERALLVARAPEELRMRSVSAPSTPQNRTNLTRPDAPVRLASESPRPPAAVLPSVMAAPRSYGACSGEPDVGNASIYACGRRIIVSIVFLGPLANDSLLPTRLRWMTESSRGCTKDSPLFKMPPCDPPPAPWPPPAPECLRVAPEAPRSHVCTAQEIRHLCRHDARGREVLQKVRYVPGRRRTWRT